MIENATEKDIPVLAELALKLWPEGNTAETLAQEFQEILEDGNAHVFIALEETIPVGFAHCQIRYEYVEGTSSNPVGYLEGIYVQPEFHRRGIASRLLQACEDWSRARGCSQFASDTELTNAESYVFHTKLGFKEANRIICFIKDL